MGGTIVWTEEARVLLMKAVIQVEYEIIIDSPSKPSPGKKWDRVNSLLPPELQGRTWNPRTKVYNRYRCRRSFDGLLAAYRGKQQRKTHVALPRRIQELMKKYEDLRNGRTSIEPKRVRKSRFSNKEITGRHRSRNDRKQPTPVTSCRSLTSQTSQGHSTDCLSRGLEISHGGAFLSRHTSERTKESVSIEEAANVDNRGRGVEKNDTQINESATDNGESIRQRASRSFNASEGPHGQNTTAGHASVSIEEAANGDNSGRGVEKNDTLHESAMDNGESVRQRASRSFSVPEGPHGQNTKSEGHAAAASAWRSMSESKNPEEMSEAAARPGVHSRAENRKRRSSDFISPPTPLSSDPAALSSTMNGTTSMTRTRHEDHLMHAILYRPQKRIDLEFSRLNSWLQRQSIPAGKQVLKEMTKISSSKRRKSNTGTAIETINDLIDESHRKRVDLHIRFSFQQLRTRLAGELKTQSLELSREVLSNFPS